MPAIEPRTKAQAELLEAITQNDVIIATGPAGTGKTYIPTLCAAIALMTRQTSRIILTRPAVEAGRRLGFLPGNLEEKYQPYLEPFEELLTSAFGPADLKGKISSGTICPKPMGFMRGLSFHDSWVLLDEAQNTTPEEMFLLLSRAGEDSKIILMGDAMQQDIHGDCGLLDAIDVLEGEPGVAVVDFGLEDIVRSDLAKRIITAYNRDLVTRLLLDTPTYETH